MENNIPVQPKNSFRVVLELHRSSKRLDNPLLAALRSQNENLNLKNISRVPFKQMFLDGKILIKGQRAKVSSGVCKGTTYVDILLK